MYATNKESCLDVSKVEKVKKSKKSSFYLNKRLHLIYSQV